MTPVTRWDEGWTRLHRINESSRRTENDWKVKHLPHYSISSRQIYVISLSGGITMEKLILTTYLIHFFSRRNWKFFLAPTRKKNFAPKLEIFLAPKWKKFFGAEMSLIFPFFGAEMSWRQEVPGAKTASPKRARRNGGAEMCAPKWGAPMAEKLDGERSVLHFAMLMQSV